MSNCNATIQVGGETVMCGRTRYLTDTHGTMSDDPHRDSLSEIAECLAWTDSAPGATPHRDPTARYEARQAILALQEAVRERDAAREALEEVRRD